MPAVASLGEVRGVVGLALGHGCSPEVADCPVEPVEAAHRNGVVVVEDDRVALGALGRVRNLERDGESRHAVDDDTPLASVLVLDPAVLYGAACYLHMETTARG